MITVTISENGSGVVELPGQSVAINANTLAAARAEAVDTLVNYSATRAVSLDVEAHDVDDTVRLSVHPYGQVVVHRNGEPGPNDLVGPDLATLPQDTPDLYQTPDLAIDTEPRVPEPPAAAQEAPSAAVTPEALLNPRTPSGTPMRPPTAPPAPAGRRAAPVLRENPAPPLDDDLDMTRIVRRTPTKPAAVLEFTTGDVLTVTGVALVGRGPVANEGEEFDDVFTVVDPARTVSKTHFAAGWHQGEFMISDRHSGNGTVIHHGDNSVTLQPGAAHTLVDGDRVDIGDHGFTVRIDTGKNL